MRAKTNTAPSIKAREECWQKIYYNLNSQVNIFILPLHLCVTWQLQLLNFEFDAADLNDTQELHLHLLTPSYLAGDTEITWVFGQITVK